MTRPSLALVKFPDCIIRYAHLLGLPWRNGLNGTAGLVAMLLCGCGLSMDQNLRPMVGQNLEVAVARLGKPESGQAASGETIYLWSSITQSSAMWMPGNMGGGMTRLGGDPSAMNSFASAVVPVAVTCSVAMAVNTTNTITRYAWRGNNCSQYLSALRR